MLVWVNLHPLIPVFLASDMIPASHISRSLFQFGYRVSSSLVHSSSETVLSHVCLITCSVKECSNGARSYLIKVSRSGLSRMWKNHFPISNKIIQIFIRLSKIGIYLMPIILSLLSCQSSVQHLTRFSLSFFVEQSLGS